MLLATAMALVLLLTAWRVASLIASVLWIQYRQPGFDEDYWKLPEWRRTRADVVWALTRKHGGGKLPWLPFGVKSRRLAYLAERSQSRGARIALKSVRGLWRWYTYALILGLALLVLGTWPVNLTGPQGALGVLLFVLLWSGCLTILVEGIVSFLNYGAWASVYHFPDRTAGRQSSPAMQEAALAVGTVALLALALGGGIAFIGARTTAIPGFSQGNVVDRYLDGLRVLVTFFLSPGDFFGADATSSSTWLGGALIIALFGAGVYAAVVTNKVLKMEGSKTASPGAQSTPN